MIEPTQGPSPKENKEARKPDAGQRQVRPSGQEGTISGQKCKGSPMETNKSDTPKGSNPTSVAPGPVSQSKQTRSATSSIEVLDWIADVERHMSSDMSHAGWLKLVRMWHVFETAWSTMGRSLNGRMRANTQHSKELGV